MERRAFGLSVLAAGSGTLMSQAEAAEREEMAALDIAIGLPWFCDVPAAGARIRANDPGDLGGAGGGRALMGDDPRLPKMSGAPSLIDFFKLRFAPANHLLQSARLARINGHSEKVILACLLHDVGMAGLLRTDHGYWGAQLVEPYVDEEVSWAIRAHQALRFFPDDSVGYAYPKAYERLFGANYKPDAYIVTAYENARKHRWYMTARLITLNDLYAFDPNVRVSIDEFAGVIGRNFKQPAAGLGFDDSPSAHMWRSIIWPNNFL